MSQRFVLVECKGRDPKAQAYLDAGWREWRVTCGETGIDFFFWSPDVAQAKRFLRRKFPGCTFSDELSGPALWTIHHGGLMQ